MICWGLRPSLLNTGMFIRESHASPRSLSCATGDTPALAFVPQFLGDLFVRGSERAFAARVLRRDQRPVRHQAPRRANTRGISRVSVLFLLVEDAVHSQSEIVDTQCRSRITQQAPSFHAQKLGDAEQKYEHECCHSRNADDAGRCVKLHRAMQPVAPVFWPGAPAMLG